MDDVLDRHGADRSVERLVVKGQPRRLVQVVDDVIGQLRIISHLLGVQPQANDFAGAKVPRQVRTPATHQRSEEHTSELQSRLHLVCRLLLEKKKKIYITNKACHTT